MNDMPESGFPEAGGPGCSASDPDIRIVDAVDGRGRMGKTVVANTMVQFFRAHRANLQVWNADHQNETHSLNTYHPDALRPPSNDAEERRLWLEERLDDQARQRYDAVLDMPGGDPTMRQLSSEARLVRTLERRNIKLVMWQVLGPELADLDYLKLAMDSGLFVPNATVLVLNTGLLRPGRAAQAAFAKIRSSTVFSSAVAQGATVAMFPALGCMSAVSDRGLTFDQAKRGQVKEGQEPLSFFDQTRAEIFWDDHVPEFFSGIARDWLPAMPGLFRPELANLSRPHGEAA